MKKLFFAAAVAIVAVGGALSANAITFYAQDSDTPITCVNALPVACSTLPSNVTYYSTSKTQGQEETDIVSYESFRDLTKLN